MAAWHINSWIGQIELHSVGKYRLGVPENSRSEDWFVEHRIATWGLRQDNGSNQWSSPAPIALRGDQMGTNLDPCWWNFCHLHSPALCNTVSHGWTDESECFPIESDVHGSSGWSELASAGVVTTAGLLFNWVILGGILYQGVELVSAAGHQWNMRKLPINGETLVFPKPLVMNEAHFNSIHEFVHATT